MGHKASKQRRKASTQREQRKQQVIQQKQRVIRRVPQIGKPDPKQEVTVHSPIPVGSLHPYQTILAYKQVCVTAPGLDLRPGIIAGTPVVGILWLQILVTPDTALVFSESRRRLSSISELQRGAKLAIDESLVSGVQFLGPLSGARQAQRAYMAGQAKLFSVYDNNFTYQVGQVARADRACGTQGCGAHCCHGIHFFLHEEDAANYFDLRAAPLATKTVIIRRVGAEDLHPRSGEGEDRKYPPAGTDPRGAAATSAGEPEPQGQGEGAGRPWPLIELQDPYSHLGILSVDKAYEAYRTHWHIRRDHAEGAAGLGTQDYPLGAAQSGPDPSHGDGFGQQRSAGPESGGVEASRGPSHAWLENPRVEPTDLTAQPKPQTDAVGVAAAQDTSPSSHRAPPSPTGFATVGAFQLHPGPRADTDSDSGSDPSSIPLLELRQRVFRRHQDVDDF